MINNHIKNSEISPSSGDYDKENIVKNLEEALSPELIEKRKNRYLAIFPKDSLDQIDGQFIADKFIQSYKTLRKYMIYEGIKTTNPGLFRTLGFNGEEEFDRRFESQKKEIKYMIDTIQPFVKENLSFFDTLVEKDEIKDMKDLYDIETIRERLITNEKLTEEEKTVILGYITLQKADNS